MRLARLIFLVLALVIGHVHACTSVWVSAEGSKCGRCLPEICGNHLPDSGELAVPSEDCHTCCRLQACHDELPSGVAVKSPLGSLVLALPIAGISFTIPPPIEIRSAYIYLEGCYPNAPPIRRSGRSPPHFS